jgi:hypothetical protein
MKRMVSAVVGVESCEEQREVGQLLTGNKEKNESSFTIMDIS